MSVIGRLESYLVQLSFAHCHITHSSSLCICYSPSTCSSTSDV